MLAPGKWFQMALFALATAGVCCALAAMEGCGAPTPDNGSANGKQQILDSVDVALSSQSCSTAVDLILPIYNSPNSDNAVRLKTASAYGCDAGINFFELLGNIANDSGNLAGPNFWPTMAKYFPSTAGKDYKMEGAFFGLDALQSVIVPGALVLPANQVNPGTNNVGSVFPADRTGDANLYMIFVGMAGIGSTESRYGSPDSSTYARGATLPWTTAVAMTSSGCGLSASILNFLDAISASENNLPTAAGKSLANIHSQLQTLLDQACAYGCSGTAPTGNPVYDPKSTWTASGCTMTVPCTSCPATLRNRSSCTAQTADANSCAAAGLTNFLNSSAAGWQQ